MSFDYAEPASLAEAIALLEDGDEDTVALAGGTAFSLLYRQGLIRPRRVVGLRLVADLQGIRTGDDGLWIGALTTHRSVENSPEVRATHSSLAAAFATIATVRIRNQGTLGGNLAHADPAQDPPVILSALAAAVHIAGPGGSRRIVPVDAFFVDYLATVLEPGELILGVLVPSAEAGTRSSYYKYLPRSADDYATVSVAVSVRLDDSGLVAAARIALGGVGPTPIRPLAAEAALIGARPDAHHLAEAAALARDAVDPLDDSRGSAAYKREMAAVWVRRALEGAVA
jgi:carbon-monoxide dehydrogenase medium subunit